MTESRTRLDLYGQAAELTLLAALRPHLRTGAAIDVGAERGEVAEQLARDGFAPLFLVEPQGACAAGLRARFAERENVRVLELAAGSADGETLLRIARGADGGIRTEFATTRGEIADTTELGWGAGVRVPCRSLDSLASVGELPGRVGLLKIDSEGSDLDILRGARELRAEIVAVELWSSLPASLGDCPYTAADLLEAAAPLGPARLLWFCHAPLHTTIKWDAAEPAVGEWGNALLLAEHLVAPADAALGPIREQLELELELRATALNEAGVAQTAQIERLHRANDELRAVSAERGETNDELRDTNEQLRDDNRQLRNVSEELRAANAQERVAAAEARRELQETKRQVEGLQGYIHSLESRSLRTRLRQLRTRLRQSPRRARARVLAQPRLGILWQSAAQPLRVPARYLTAQPPQPAPLISIVTPALHGAPFIERTLRSVLDQDYPALEYVVQDGGSADGTAAILERYDDRLARWTSAPDEGQAHALNLGFADTRGELMAYLNADDILLPGSLAYVSAYFAAHPDVDVVYGHRVIIDHNGHRVGVWVTPRHCDHALRHVDYVPQETTFWRRNIWEAIGGGFDEELHFAMDWDLLLRFRAAGARFVRLPRLVGAFRVLPGQKTQAQADVGERECMRMRKQHLGRALTHEQAGALVRGYLRRSAAHHLAFRARERLEPRWVTVEAGPIESRTGAPPQATSVPR